jgi:hypothetical protein
LVIIKDNNLWVRLDYVFVLICQDDVGPVSPTFWPPANVIMELLKEPGPVTHGLNCIRAVKFPKDAGISHSLYLGFDCIQNIHPLIFVKAE